ncbi:glycosyl hydrolase 53 family protein [Prevotella sp. A2931]|uniref:Arabinogalactan endo-beta-1,4-galactanase n=2 Tax=Prevotellaceae TaxID=171552 RepID=A0ABS3M2A3_9BACT|nr:glycosyl hydrolase 53 family protein [Prevotella illustrans]PTL27333.1 arabinogalactan endo-1,4-beta-galactosidase [Prevotella sp. oral taxon 820]
MKKNIISFLFSILALSGMASCEQEINPKSIVGTDTTRVERGTFAKGADVSWLTQLEHEGQVFYNGQGQPQECMALLKEQCGVNAIRLRVWVNPAEGWNNMQDVLVKARRAHRLGLRLMIDFHFSDTWADPAHQATPAAWADYDLEQMKTAVADHVKAMLSLLKTYDIEPEWVQIGNETRGGMLYPLGKIENGANLAQLFNAGYATAKSVFADTQVIVHIDCGDRLELYTRMFDYLKQQGGKYDMIGMSLYPEASNWQAMAKACVENVAKLYQTYGKPVMLCEIGMGYQEASACRRCIAAIMRDGRATGHLQGIFYWEPEAPAGYNGGYDKGCFDNGRPTEALDAFRQ